MLDLHVLHLLEDAVPAPAPASLPTPLRVVSTPAPEPAGAPQPDYESLSIPQLCRVILDADRA